MKGLPAACWDDHPTRGSKRWQAQRLQAVFQNSGIDVGTGLEHLAVGLAEVWQQPHAECIFKNADATQHRESPLLSRPAGFNLIDKH